MAQEVKVVIRGENQAGQAFKSAQNDANALSDTIGQLKKVLVAVAGAEVIKGFLTSAASYEQNTIAFTTMLGSAENAQSLLADLAEFGKQTPFELSGLVTASKQLVAYGVAQEDIIPTMKTMGDISAGLGVDVGRLTTVFGQVKLAGRLMGGDLLQFTNAGVPLVRTLAQQMGKTEAEIKDMVSAGKIGFEDVKGALESMSGEGGQFFNLMEKQSASLGGMWSNVKDGLSQVSLQIGMSLLPMAKKAVDFILQMMPTVAAIVTRVVDAFATFASIAKPAVDKVIEVVKIFGIGLQDTSDDMDEIAVYGKAMSDVLGIDISGAADIAYQAIMIFKQILENVVSYVQVSLIPAIMTIVDTLVTSFTPILAAVSTFITETFIPAFAKISYWITNKGLPLITSLVTSIVTSLQPTFQAIASFITNTVLPIFKKLSNWFTEQMLPKIEKLIPVLQKFWEEILAPVVNWVVATALPILGDLANFFANTLMWSIGFAVDAITWLMEKFLWLKDGVLTVFSTLSDTIGGFIQNARDAITGFFTAGIDIAGSIANAFRDIINSLVDKINATLDISFSILGQDIRLNFPDLPRFALGTSYFGGGMAMVGERGAEVVRLPRGSEIIPNPQGGQSSVTNNFGDIVFHSNVDVQEFNRDLGFLLRTAGVLA